MKTLFLLCYLIFCVGGVVSGQNKNLFKLTAGGRHIAPGSGIRISTPFWAFQYERRIGRIGLAAFLGYSQFSGYREGSALTISYTVKDQCEVFMVGLKGNLYLIQKGKLEVYGGGMLGGLHVVDNLYLESVPAVGTYTGTRGANPAKAAGGLKLGCQVGAHLWLRPHIGIAAELGYGMALANAGVALRF